MNRLRLLAIALSCTALLSCKEQEINVIPVPMRMDKGQGSFEVSQQTPILIAKNDSDAARVARYFKDMLATKGLQLDISEEETGDLPRGAVLFTRRGAPDSLGHEGYKLTVNGSNIVITAASGAGLFYGVQTLRQLMPPGFDREGSKFSKLKIPAVTVLDQPRFRWRGMNFDCCRHFMTKDFVKRYIDLLAYHKMNIFHWHLTEDQGWRIEIKKYPKLTQIGAWRNEADGSVYGGFYSQEDIKEVVAYAAERFVNVVPEIEMPGHSTAALAAYPQLSCTGGPFEVATTWGVFKDIYCAGNDSTFTFMQHVLDEVIELFPFQYIHIGGDEAPKERWQKCPKCQKRIKAEKLKNEEELQRYFISRIARYLETKGRRIIGWDEILEGGIPDLATVQSWRGFEGAQTAALAGVDAIVSPTSHCYFDYPVESVDLEKVYSFEPIPSGLSTEQTRHIIGGECNMWSEHAPQEVVDAKMFPRTLAMAEVLWSPASGRDYKEFYARVQRHYARLNDLGVMYGPEQGTIKFLSTMAPDFKSMEVQILKGQTNLSVRYTLDGSEPTPSSTWYKKPFSLKKTTQVKAAGFMGDKLVGQVYSQKFVLSKSTGKEIKLSYQPADKYTGGGVTALIDGRKGTGNFNDGIWQGVQGQNMEALIFLGEEMEINSISTGFLQANASWIFIPASVTYMISNDGVNFANEVVVPSDVSPKDGGLIVKDFTAQFPGVRGKYIKMVATSIGTIPDWHPAAGYPSWLFADEIAVE